MTLYFVQLNELNFDLLKSIDVNTSAFPNFNRFIDLFDFQETFAENEYQNLEPWIQWVSFYTGQSFSEHKIFHLGDTEKKGTTETIFQKMERKGLRVGALADECCKSPSKSIIFYS